MGVNQGPSHQEDKMMYLVLAAVLALSSSAPQLQYPSGVSAIACPNYPFCGSASPAALPTPVINGENVAPGLNTVPSQTRAHENHQLIAQQQQLQQLIDSQTIQHRIQQQEIEAARHFGRLWIFVQSTTQFGLRLLT